MRGGQKGAQAGNGEKGRDAKTSFPPEMAASYSSCLMESGGGAGD